MEFLLWIIEVLHHRLYLSLEQCGVVCPRWFGYPLKLPCSPELCFVSAVPRCYALWISFPCVQLHMGQNLMLHVTQKINHWLQKSSLLSCTRTRRRWISEKSHLQEAIWRYLVFISVLKAVAAVHVGTTSVTSLLKWSWEEDAVPEV